MSDPKQPLQTLVDDFKANAARYSEQERMDRTAEILSTLANTEDATYTDWPDIIKSFRFNMSRSHADETSPDAPRNLWAFNVTLKDARACIVYLDEGDIASLSGLFGSDPHELLQVKDEDQRHYYVSIAQALRLAQDVIALGVRPTRKNDLN